jgi:hypothetical protein
LGCSSAKKATIAAVTPFFFFKCFSMTVTLLPSPSSSSFSLGVAQQKR